LWAQRSGRSTTAVGELDELLTDSGRRSAGTVVEAGATSALVEISDDRGHAIDVVSLPHDALAPAGVDATRAPSRAAPGAPDRSARRKRDADAHRGLHGGMAAHVEK
jgi:hypothetical protein